MNVLIIAALTFLGLGLLKLALEVAVLRERLKEGDEDGDD